jgi:hypothetical protein
MPNRHTDRERWEVMILTVLLAYRPFIFIGGCLFLLYAGLTWITYPLMALVSMGLSVFLFLLVFLDQACLYLARFGAWLKTLGGKT